MSATKTNLNLNPHADANGTVGSLALRASTVPIKRNGSLDKYEHFEVTPIIGEEFSGGVQLRELVHAANRDELLKDLATLGEHACSGEPCC
jgi:hypothetical protein